MYSRISTIVFAALLLSIAAYGQAIPGVPADALQVRYAANLNISDSFINITNAGTQNTAGALTNICVNVYAFGLLRCDRWEAPPSPFPCGAPNVPGN